MQQNFAVEAEYLCKSFTDKATRQTITALQHINLKIEEGSLTALIGPDGAGKTTLLRLICGLLRPSSGILRVLGLDAVGQAQQIQDQLSYMPQKFGLYEDLTCQENLDLYADLHGIPQDIRTVRFNRLLEITGLTPFTGRLAGKLSGGMKQKLGLVCTLVRSPRLLLLDEPTAGVDPLSRRELWRILKKLAAEEHISVLISTAYMDEAELCRHVIVLDRGHVLAEASPAALKALMENRVYTAAPPDASPPRILQAALLDDTAAVIDAVPEKGRVRFSLKNGRPTGLKAQGIFPSLQPLVAAPCLEDSFMLLLSRASGRKKSGSTLDFTINYQTTHRPASHLVIEVKDLVRKFGDFTAVDHISFQVHEGEIFGLLGPNGAGKSTTFKMLCGLLPATEGSLSVAGVDLRTARAQARGNIGYVAQKFSLYGTLSVHENLKFFGGAYGLSHKQLQQRIEEVARQFRLTEVMEKPANQLPVGYQQRLSMAAALIHQPRILFLDEPTSGIDPLARRAFWRQITSLAAAGTTVIITTHFMEEAEYCDRILIQDQGKMLILGTPEQVRLRGGRDATVNEAFIAIVEENRSPEQAGATDENNDSTYR